MNPNYSISKPCSEDWNKMTAEEQGRHCQVCCKTVVDFSQKSNDEIVGFLQKNVSSKVCGRFRKEQLQPHKISNPRNRYRTFFAALIFVFGGMLFTSCASNHSGGGEVMGDVAYVPDSLHPQNNGDTVKKSAIIDTTKKVGMKEKCVVPATIKHEPEHLQGEVVFVPDTIK